MKTIFGSPNRIGLILLLLCTYQLTKGQSTVQENLTFRFGEELKSKQALDRFIGQIDDKIYGQAGEKDKKYFFLECLDVKTLQINFEKKIILPEYDGKRTELLSINIFNDEFIIFLEAFQRKNDVHVLLAQKMNNQGELLGDVIKLDEISAERKKNAGSFHYEINGQRILLFSSPPFEKYAKEKLTFKVLDATLHVVWENALELPYLDRNVSIKSYNIDENDNLVVLCSVNDFKETKEAEGTAAAKAERAKDGSDYSFSILTYDYKNQYLKEYKIELGLGRNTVNLYYNIEKEGDISICGLYGDASSYGNGKGIYVTRIHGATRTCDDIKVKEFDNEFIAGRIGEKAADKGRGIGFFGVRQFIPRDDGGIHICGEISYWSQHCSRSKERSGLVSCTRYFYYGDIIVISANKFGDIEWIRTIDKVQNSSYSFSSVMARNVMRTGPIVGNKYWSYSPLASYAVLRSDQSLHFLYNDSPKNYESDRDPDKTYSAKEKKMITTISRIDINGNVYRQPNSELKAVKMVLHPKVRLTPIKTNNRMYILAGSKRQERLVEITVQ
jgi:hypothetical protein